MTNSQTSLRAKPRLGNVNIQAVADAAGVSKTTVSHVISGKRPVSASTKRKVQKVMAELGFEPNFFARAMQSQRSNSVALIVQDIANPYYPALARGLQEALTRAGDVVMLFDGRAGEQLTDVFVKEILQRRVDGVVAAAPLTRAEVSRLLNGGVAVVAVGPATDRQDIDWVSADDAQIADDATTYLVRRGHKRIATIHGPEGSEPGTARVFGWKRAMDRAELAYSDADMAIGDWTTEGGAAAANVLLDCGTPPDAVFCANDLMAIGALNAVMARGLRVPEDVALIGVDDIAAAALVRPALTSVRVPAEEIGRAAGDLLQRRLADAAATPDRHVLVGHKLVERASA